MQRSKRTQLYWLFHQQKQLQVNQRGAEVLARKTKLAQKKQQKRVAKR